MRILLTGSSSFVGKSVVKMLEESGYEIFHLVRDNKGFKNEFLWDFKGLLPAGLPTCHVIIHLAAHVDFGLEMNISQYNVNTVSTIKLSGYSRVHNAYFILASMAGIHGGQYTVIDKNTPVNPWNHYAMSKYLAEEVIRTHVDNYSILRISGIYGLDGPSHLGLNNSINDAFYKKKPPVLKGHGKAKRNYICVLDVARWIMFLVRQCEAASGARINQIRETIYMAGPEVMSIEEYLQILVETTLPDKQLVRLEGKESNDLIISVSPAPFEMTTFRQYINSLLSLHTNL